MDIENQLDVRNKLLKKMVNSVKLVMQEVFCLRFKNRESSEEKCMSSVLCATYDLIAKSSTIKDDVFNNKKFCFHCQRTDWKNEQKGTMKNQITSEARECLIDTEGLIFDIEKQWHDSLATEKGHRITRRRPDGSGSCRSRDHGWISLLPKTRKSDC
ncbi:unnamed protein product [Caenorhabditis nigoni]